MELVKKEVFNLITEEDVEMLIQFERLQAKVKMMKSQKDAALKEWMKANNLKSYVDEVHGIKVTYKAPSKRKMVDSIKLKEDGVYDLYLKEIDVSESVSVELIYDD